MQRIFGVGSYWPAIHFRSLKAIKTPASVALLLALFFACSWDGLLVPFDSDDLMNLHEGWMIPLSRVLAALTNPATDLYRPSGALYYRTCFAIFGWNPFAFRVVFYCLLLFNIFLVFRLGRALKTSRAASYIACLLFSFHPRMWQYFTSGGTIYDVLCCSLCLVALKVHIEFEPLETKVHSKFASAFYRYLFPALLLAIALNAKEMAVVFPALILLYSCIYSPPYNRHAISLKLLGQIKVPLFFTGLTTLFLWGKLGNVGPLQANPAYRLSFTWDQFLSNSQRLYADLLRMNDRMTPKELLAFAFAVGVFFFVYRKSKPVRFLAAFVLLTPLPIMFIPWRGSFVMYIPLVGWTILVGVLLTDLKQKIVGWKPLVFGVPSDPFTSLIVLVSMVTLIYSGVFDKVFSASSVDPLSGTIERTKGDLMHLSEPLPYGASILMLHSRFPDDAWGPLMIARLLYGDRELALDRPTMLEKVPELSSYDRVVDLRSQHLIVTSRKPADKRTTHMPHTYGRWFY